ncbi:MAG: outer membrane beta-barrel protein [Alphaproteobacteria bacterium]|nr:outer membrane beta-barrel protein [Alphaproteobacteria bacterium]
MRKSLVPLAALGAWVALAGTALADTCCRGFYVGAVVLGGGGFIGDLRSVGPTTGLLKDDEAKDSVAGGGAAIGFNWKKLGAPIRTEIEWAHIVRLDYDSRPIFTNNLSQAGFEDNVSTTTIMLNVLYDFDVGSSWWRPYAGFGVGYARNKSDVNYNNFSAAPGPNGETKVNEEFTTSNLAWALTAGGNFDITQNWYAEAAYRFIHTGEIEAGNTAAGVRIEGDTIYRHELRLAFGYRF